MKISERELRRRARQRAMSIAEFCDCYGPGRTKVYEELKSGRLRARKIGKRTIITEDDAEEWLRHLPLIKAGRTSKRAKCLRRRVGLRDAGNG